MKSINGAQDTGLRYLVMLQAMPLGRWLTLSAIAALLADRGHIVTDRTIQRDLWKLAEQFGLEQMEVCGPGSKYVWRRTLSLEVMHGTAERAAA